MAMTPEAYERIFEIFTRARELPPQARLAFVARSCQHDPHIHEKVLGLLDRADQTNATTAGREAVGALAQVLTTTPEESAPPTQLGRFVVLRKLGSGGMGTVYLGYDNDLDRKVALKVLHAQLVDQTEASVRMQREAQAMAKLAHPNVVRVFEVGLDDNRIFAAMEFIDGETLAAWLRRHGPPTARDDVDRRLNMVYQGGEGLAAAHAQGIIHRDFKPDNILCDQQGGIHVADFGLARQEHGGLRQTHADGSEPDGEAPALACDVTISRAILGTPGYMAPEQIAGGDLDVRTDIFAFCVTLYETLYGVRPFAGNDVGTLARAIAGQEILPPPPDTYVDTWIFQHIRRGLHADPQLRWPSMRALLDALSDNPIQRRRRRRQWLVGVGLMAGLAIAGYVAIHDILAARDVQVAQNKKHTRSAQKQRDVARATAAEAAMRARDHLRMAVLRDAVDPTTRVLILAEVEAPDKTEGFVNTARALLQTPVSRAIVRGNGSPILSLNFLDRGRYLAIHSRDGRMQVVRHDGQGPAAILELGEGHGNAVRLGEHRLAVPMANKKIGVFEFEPTADKPLRRLQTLNVPFVASYLDVDPSYRRLAAIDEQTSDAVVFDLEHGNRLGTFPCSDNGLWHADLSPGGQNLVLTSNKWEVCYASVDNPNASTPAPRRGTGVFHPNDPANMLLIGGSGAALWSGQQAAPAKPLFSATDMFTWTVDPGGQFVVGNNPQGQITRYPLNGTPTIDYGVGGRGFGSVEVSPDGAWIAAIDRQEVVVWATNTPERRATLALPEADRSTLVFSDGGERLASASRWGDVHIWELAAIEPRHHLTAGDAVIHEIAAAAGTMVTTLANDEVVWWQTDRTTPLHQLSHPQSVVPAVSDDGRIGVVGIDSGDVLVGTRDGTTTWLKGHSGVVWNFDFSPDNKWLISGSEDASARVWNLETQEAQYILNGHQSPLSNVSLGPRGHRAATVGDDGSLRLWVLGDNPTPVATELHPPNPLGIARTSFSPDGRWLLAHSHGTTAYLWDLSSRRPEPLAHTGVLTQACWDPQARWFATATRDGVVRLWDPQTRDVLAEHRHPRAVEQLRCAPDGKHFATTSAGVVRHFLVGSTGADQLNVGPHLESIAYTQDSQGLYYGTRDGIVSRWTPLARLSTPDALLRELRKATTACLTAHQRQWILREPRALAQQRLASCERSFGREPTTHASTAAAPFAASPTASAR